MITTPLDDLVVLDFTLALSGPYATRLLGGLGARVIKVEAPAGPVDPARGNAPHVHDGHFSMRPEQGSWSVPFLDRGRGKESLTLDLKHPDSASVIADLVAKCDLVVQNWSPGVARRLGVDYERLAELNPAVVVLSITGFGNDVEPDEVPTTKAMDAIIQAMSGFMMTGGAPGDPPVMSGVPVADLVSPLFGVIGALAAVHEARRSGAGGLVDVSMLGALTSLVAAEPHAAYETLGTPSRPGLSVQRLAPFGVYPTVDGHVALCAPTDQFAHAVLDLVGGRDDGRFVDRPGRVEHADVLDETIATWSAQRTTAEAVAALVDGGIPAAPVRSPLEAVSDPLVWRRGEVEAIEDRSGRAIPNVAAPGVPIRFWSSRPQPDQTEQSDQTSTGPQRPSLSPAPRVGEHTHSVLSDFLGYDLATIERLEADGVV